MPIHHFAPLLHSTTTSNHSSLKVRVDSPVVVVEYTTACSTGSERNIDALIQEIRVRTFKQSAQRKRRDY